MSNIFVAGHTGLLGSAILEELLNKGYKNILTKTHKELDLKNYKKTDKFFKQNKIDILFMCVGKSGGIMDNKNHPADYFFENITIINNLFNIAIKNEVKKIIYYASSCVYPKNSPQPIKEEYLCEGKMEETSLGYSAAKLAGIYGAIAYNKQYGKRILTLIPNTIYGKNDKFDENSHVLSALIKKFYEAKKNNKDVILWGSGEVYREFIYDKDIARASVFAMENFERIKEDYLNVGSGEEISIKDLASLISRIIGFRGKIIWDTTKPNGVKRKLLDSSKFRSYGWKSEVSLEEGIKDVIKDIKCLKI
jgi:GDP-L-fucose synthase